MRDATKRFGAAAALSGLSLDVRAGELVAVVGENGSGKTTLLRVLAGVISPDAGTAAVAGSPAGSAAARARLGLVPASDRSLFWRLSVAGNLAFAAALHGLPPAAARARTHAVLVEAGLWEARRRRAGDLSSGQRQRAALSRALLSDPDVVLADEPTRSLDPGAAEEAWRRFAALAAAGKAVIVATHDAGAAARHAHRVARLSGGRLVEDRRLREAVVAPGPLAPPRRVPWGLAARARLVAAALAKDMSIRFGYRWAAFLRLAQIASSLAVFFFIGRLVEPGGALPLPGGGYFAFVLVWLAFQGIQTLALSGFVSEVRAGQLTGTLEAVAAAPAPLAEVLAASVLGRLLVASAEGMVCLALGTALFGVSWTAAGLPALAAAFLFMTLSLAGLGLASAGFVLVHHVGAPFVAAYGALSSLLGGAFYPVEALPPLLARASTLFPLTAFLRAARGALLAGRPPAAVDLWLLAAWGIGGLAAGGAAFAWGLRAARRRGTLSQY